MTCILYGIKAWDAKQDREFPLSINHLRVILL